MAYEGQKNKLNVYIYYRYSLIYFHILIKYLHAFLKKRANILKLELILKKES